MQEQQGYENKQLGKLTAPGMPPNKVNSVKPDTMTRIIFEKFWRNKLAVIGAIILIIIISAALLAPFIVQHPPEKQYLMDKLLPPSKEYWLGTDHLGRDLFSRLLYGARISLMVGFASIIGAITIGTVVGALAGYYGGKVDGILMRFVDVFISFPNIFLLITIVSIFQPSVDKLIIVFALIGWMGTARLVRGEFLSLRSREFVLAARTLGVRSSRIIFFHILPNALGPIIVAATLGVGGIILAEAALSFLGLGVQPPTASWGNMLQGAQSLTIMLRAWWYPVIPGLMILITVLCFNFVGDGLRDAFDPRIKN